MGERKMNLQEACEGVFQMVCLLNRSARKGAPLELNLVRAQLKQALSKARSRASADPFLAQQYEQVERPLVYFIDCMIEESTLPFAGQWKSHWLQEEMYGVTDGDEHFFDLLDETLADQRREATERLVIFYTCIGLGFTGFYKGQPEFLRRKMMEMNARIRDVVNIESGTRIVPEAYEHVDQSNLVQPPTRSLVSLVVAVGAVVVALVVLSVGLYWTQTAELGRALDWLEALLS